MKFGCCVNMCGNEKDPGGLRMLEDVKRAGYDYVELPLAECMQLDDKAFQTLLERLRSLDLPCEACNNFFPGNLRLTGENRDIEAIRTYLPAALKRAAQLGARTIVFGSAKAKYVPEGFPMDRAWAQVEDDVRIIGEALDKVGLPLVIAIEPVCRRECNIVLTYAEGCDLAEKAKRPNVQCLVDYYHMTVENEPVEHLNRGELRHVHISNPNGRVYPRRGDGAGYERFFEMLKSIGYDRCVSIEAYTDDFMADSIEALACLRSLAK